MKNKKLFYCLSRCIIIITGEKVMPINEIVTTIKENDNDIIRLWVTSSTYNNTTKIAEQLQLDRVCVRKTIDSLKQKIEPYLQKVLEAEDYRPIGFTTSIIETLSSVRWPRPENIKKTAFFNFIKDYKRGFHEEHPERDEENNVNWNDIKSEYLRILKKNISSQEKKIRNIFTKLDWHLDSELSNPFALIENEESELPKNLINFIKKTYKENRKEFKAKEKIYAYDIAEIIHSWNEKEVYESIDKLLSEKECPNWLLKSWNGSGLVLKNLYNSEDFKNLNDDYIIDSLEQNVVFKIKHYFEYTFDYEKWAKKIDCEDFEYYIPKEIDENDFWYWWLFFDNLKFYINLSNGKNDTQKKYTYEYLNNFYQLLNNSFTKTIDGYISKEIFRISLFMERYKLIAEQEEVMDLGISLRYEDRTKRMFKDYYKVIALINDLFNTFMKSFISFIGFPSMKNYNKLQSSYADFTKEINRIDSDIINSDFNRGEYKKLYQYYKQQIEENQNTEDFLFQKQLNNILNEIDKVTKNIKHLPKKDFEIDMSSDIQSLGRNEFFLGNIKAEMIPKEETSLVKKLSFGLTDLFNGKEWSLMSILDFGISLNHNKIAVPEKTTDGVTEKLYNIFANSPVYLQPKGTVFKYKTITREYKQYYDGSLQRKDSPYEYNKQEDNYVLKPDYYPGGKYFHETVRVLHLPNDFLTEQKTLIDSLGDGCHQYLENCDHLVNYVAAMQYDPLCSLDKKAERICELVCCYPKVYNEVAKSW